MRRWVQLPLTVLASIWGLAPACAGAAEQSGQWQEKTEIIWDANAAKLVRRSFRVWDPHPELNLEFSWLPASESGKRAGSVSGDGELTWYREGAALYDRKLRYSTYSGSLKDGRPDGFGKLWMRSGLSYEGGWKDGRMEGLGSIDYESGERYVGNFSAGEPDGSGKYIAANGEVLAGRPRRGQLDNAPAVASTARSLSKVLTMAASVEPGPNQASPASSAAVAGAGVAGPVPLPVFPTDQSPSFANTALAQATKIAQASGDISMTLYVDRVKNTEFKEGGGELESFVYDQTTDPGATQIRLEAPQILERWKGGGTIVADENTYLLEPAQFAPVFLVVDLVNDSDRDAQIVGGYIDVTESAADLQPYLEITAIDYFLTDEKLDPTFTLLNAGWGPVQNAKMTYSFGAGSQTFAIDAATFDQSQEVSVLPAFVASGVNVADVKNGRFVCASYEEVPNCLADLVQTGLFGQLGGAMFAEYKHVYTRMEGVIDYSWTDSHGTPQQSQSPISIKIPVLDFDVGPTAEYGAPAAVDRNLPAFKLALDKQNYRIPFSYREPIGAQQNKRFSMTIDAEQSSSHQFKVVLEFADGTTVSSPPADLLIFKPRAVQLY